jgi:predicted secreted Zn-dependent protease
MKIRFARLIYVAILWLSFTVADAQPYRKLTLDDFRGNPNTNNTGVVAYTNCSIAFSYTAYKEKDYYILNFIIKLDMNNDKSWMNRSRLTTAEMAAEILKHEQGHYNIAYMEQQELLRTVGRTVFHSDYERVAKQIFNRIDAKYQQLNHNYDDDTQHSANREQQHSWDMYFKKRLELEYLAGN